MCSLTPPRERDVWAEGAAFEVETRLPQASGQSGLERLKCVEVAVEADPQHAWGAARPEAARLTELQVAGWTGVRGRGANIAEYGKPLLRLLSQKRQGHVQER